LGKKVPRNGLLDALPQFLDLPAFLRAGLEVAIEPELLEQSVQSLFAYRYGAAIGACRDQELFHGHRRRPLALIRQAQRTFPVAYARQRIGLAARIEHHQRHGHFVQMELMDHAVAWLSGKVPKERLAGLLTIAAQFDLLGLKRPNSSPWCRVGGLKGFAVEYQAEPRLANARIA